MHNVHPYFSQILKNLGKQVRIVHGKVRYDLQACVVITLTLSQPAGVLGR